MSQQARFTIRAFRKTINQVGAVVVVLGLAVGVLMAISSIREEKRNTFLRSVRNDARVLACVDTLVNSLPPSSTADSVAVVATCLTNQYDMPFDSAGFAARLSLAWGDRLNRRPVRTLPVEPAIDSLPPGVTREMISQGENIFKDAGGCWACHGVDAKGDRGVGANLTDDDWWHNDGSYEGIVSQIITGVPAAEARNVHGVGMPPRGGNGISDEQVRSVAAYVWTLRFR